MMEEDLMLVGRTTESDHLRVRHEDKKLGRMAVTSIIKDRLFSSSRGDRSL